MHGTFRSPIDVHAVHAVRFDARELARRGQASRAGMAVLLAGTCLAALTLAPQLKLDGPSAPSLRPTLEMPGKPLARPVQPVIPQSPGAGAPESLQGAQSLRDEPPEPTAVAASQAVKPALSRVPAPRAAVDGPEAGPSTDTVEPLDAIIIQLPDPTPANSIPTIAAEPLPPPPLAVNLPDPPVQYLAAADQPATASVPEVQPSPSASVSRPVDIAQISESDIPSLRVPQLHEPGLTVGGEPALSAKIAAMQVTPLPPVRYPESERALLLAEAPTQMMVRIGDMAVGKIDFRMTDAGTVDVRLSGLLDVLAGHYDAAEFARLRNSAAADAYVSFDRLRAMGLNVRYDPVYDEVRIAG